VFDIIAAHQHQLPLPINIEGVHHAQTGLAGPATRRTHPPGKKGAHDQKQNKKQNDDHDRAEHIGRGDAKFVEQGLHCGFHPADRRERP
jgi:hypothetical protein